VMGKGCVRRGVIVLTNRWDHAAISDRLAEWGVQVLPKPFSPTRLSQLVESIAAGQSTRREPTRPVPAEGGART
jgi:DNA-binding NtrC family response regulator